MKRKFFRGILPCFYCSADSGELKFFLIAVIGGLVLFSVFSAIGLYLKGYFKNTEDMSDYPLRIEQKKGDSFE